MTRPSMTHERGDMPPRIYNLAKLAVGLASAALTGTVAVAVHCVGGA